MWNGKYKRGWIAWAIAALLALGIAAAFGASAIVGSDWARQYLVRKIETASGRRLHADALTLRLTPALRIDATGLGISNPEWARTEQEPDFLRVQSASLKIRLLPLLIGRVRVAQAQLDGVQLFLARGVATDNWHFQSGTEEKGAPAARKGGALVLPEHVSMRQAAVQYRTIGADGKDIGKPRRWQLPAMTLDANGRQAQVDIQLAADNRTMHLGMRTDDLPALQKGETTQIAMHAEVPGQAGAGNIDIKGALGLARDLGGTDLRVHIDAPTDSPWQFLMGSAQRKLAAIKLDVALRGRDSDLQISQLAFGLGDLRVSGQGVIHTGQAPWRVEGQLRTAALDWVQMTRDAGLPQPPPKPPGALFRDVPLAWPLLQDIKGYTVDLELQLDMLKLRSGLPLQNVKAKVQLQTDQMRIPAFSANFAGGTATADALFTGHDRRVKLNLKASGVSIEQWRDLLNKPKLFSGAPLAVNASVSASGASMNQLAATMTGPVSLRMGRTAVHSTRGSDAETLLTGLVPALGGKRADHMNVVCLVASLPFDNGRAAAASIAGARSESSQLLTDGVVDLRDQTLDLHGRVTGVDGARLGLSMFAGDVNISGKLVKPRFRLDARGVLGTAARVGAAVLSFGLTAVGQTLWDANADDACKVAAQRPETKRPAVGERAAPR
ncbi:MAG TPA: AsmA family protein [Herbaspirillum sp.]|jgi:uncharacterized protein involved in outer membrane biogenesis